ncbi:MAG: DUF4011 domain-containing protein [Clostridia bacterium]|nr:DUF4011 domain-containing protein [Clostridia bacterium]
MLKDDFLMYAQGVRRMLAHNRSWRTSFEASLPQFFPRDESHGYSKILASLAVEAYEIVSAHERGFIVPDELAALLRVRAEQKNYKRAAYYFAITVFAVALDKMDEDDADPDKIDADELFEFDTSAIIPTETDPLTAKLMYYKNRLLDFSRNNQLVHFRNTKNGTLQLCSPSITSIFSSISAGKKIYIGKWNELKKKPKQIMRCKICNRYMFRPYDAATARFAEKCPTCDVRGTGNRKSMVSIPEGLTLIDEMGYECPECGSFATVDSLFVDEPKCLVCGKVTEFHSYPIMTATSLQAQFGANTVICANPDAASMATADNLMKKAERLERNFGLHAIYLACGFLDWVDISGTNYHSPILLSRINLHLDRAAGRYYFQLDTNADAPFVVNKTLFRMLSAYSQTVSIPLPDYDELGGTYFENLRELWNITNASVASITANWTIRPDMGIGFFHYQKLQLERDIEKNMERYLAHPIIRRLCGDTELIIEDAQKLSSSLEHMTMDADSSQEKVIRASQDGHSFILQGPPGSGKSQTISNIISVAIGEGKTVLFVTEKATARSIIVDNLSGREVDGTHNLSNFVLDFDKFSTRRGAIGQKPLLEEINNARDPAISVMGFDTILADESYYRGQIEAYMDQLTTTHNGRSYQNYIQDIAPYLEYSSLRSLEEMNGEIAPLPQIISTVRKYYDLVGNGTVKFDYKEDSLFGFSGADTHHAQGVAEKYLEANRTRHEIYRRLENDLGIIADETVGSISGLAEALDIWTEMPALDAVALEAIKNVTDIERLQKYARDRLTLIKERNTEPGSRHLVTLNPNAVTAYSAGEIGALVLKYKNFIKRLFSRRYRKALSRIFEYSVNKPQKIKYKHLKQFSENLEEYRRYHTKVVEYRNGEDRDIELFGRVIDSAEEWEALVRALRDACYVLNHNKSRTIPLAKNEEFIKRFSYENHSHTVEILKEFSRELRELAAIEAENGEHIKSYFSTLQRKNLSGHQRYEFNAELASKMLEAGERMIPWSGAAELLGWLKESDLLPILDELIRKRVTDPLDAENMISRAYYVKTMREFANENSLAMLKGFTSEAHHNRISHYASADLETLKGGATRLYNTLSEKMNEAGAEYKRSHRSTLDLPKIQSKTGASISQIIKDNWDYIKHIKPCFMMSPLNASQYIDISLEFDMVIFDEASQIFTEDALASIVRGKQIIIAGDSKQLPPCDFFRAGGNHGDIADEDSAVDEDDDAKDSLLIAADKALGDISISLDWHYRSYDEALIASSNENFEYNLITFPSAIKNPNDGIEMVKVPYSPDTCYVAGKRGTHINSGEADTIVQLLWREINHPKRSSFSLGVVAFSNAQALEIENRWRAFKEKPEYKATIDTWEAAHESEPIIFCNLDTMQGDERDTMLTSICYSPDPDGKFNLTYLGAIRLEAGKKRINVAITRSRHRMVVVSTLEVSTLANAIATSSAPDHNKEGADTLCRFLSYAETFRNENKPVTAPTTNAFTRAICRALDKNGIAYDTEIGRSECRISIGIKDKRDPNSYVLGIIVDDPNRTDFDSAREYARLTEQVLCGKYNWTLYRVFPIAWINSYRSELEKLMSAVNQALKGKSKKQ